MTRSGIKSLDRDRTREPESHHFANELRDVVQIVGEFFTDLPKELDGLGERADGVSDPHGAIHRLWYRKCTERFIHLIKKNK